MSNTANVMNLLSTYSTVQEPKATKAVNEERITVGKVFLQPTGGKNGKPLNYSYCYFGLSDASGFIVGFSCSNRKMLELVASKAFSSEITKDITEAFKQYAEKNAALGHVVIK